ncbi:MAG: PadR family transcriptional regulator [Candidatus Thorarchaeota archaeon]
MNDASNSEPTDSLDPLPLVRAILLSEIWANPGSSGYDLMKLSSELIDSYVPIQSGTVYGELRNMQKEELVISKQEDSGRRRREYRITERGKKTLERLYTQIKSRVEYVLTPLLSLIQSLTQGGS